MSTPPPVSPTSPGRLHRGVNDAVHKFWNCQFEEAEAIFNQRKNTNPRFSLEAANMVMIRGLMNSTNESREKLLDLFKHADGLASTAKYGEPMISDSSEEEDEAIARSAEEDMDQMTPEDRKKIDKLKHEDPKKRKEREKAAFKAKQKELAKAGQSMDMSWKIECDVIYADALLVRSLVQLTMNSYLKGGINLRKTWGCYYALLQEVEKDTTHQIPFELAMNIKYGCGVFYTYLALVPAGLMRLLSAIGFISDKEMGEQFLTEVFQSETIRSPFAALVLCTYYLFLPTGLGDVNQTLSKAKVVLDTMNERYPNNTHFHGYTNFYHRKRGETKEAVTAIIHATSNAEKADCVPLLLRYLHADTLYMDLQFAAARDKYKEVLETLEETGETFAYTGQVVLSLAACYVMLGDDAAAMTWVKRVNSMYNTKSKQDANSPKFAYKITYEKRLLPLLGVYILYINRDLAHMKKEKVAELRTALNNVCKEKDMSPLEVQGMYNLFMGVMNKACGDKDGAFREWEKTLPFEKKLASDSMVMPYTYYEMGEAEFRRGNYETSKAHFEKGQTLKGDGNETLANRYSIAMKQLKREMSKK